MKTTLLAGSMLLIAFSASADPAYTVTDMSCESVKAAVRAEGSAILHYKSKRNPGLPLYGRYVTNRRFCSPGEIMTFGSVPTADDKACPLYQCVFKLRSGRRG